MDSLGEYLNGIARIPLLTPAEEIELGHAIQAMMVIIEDPDLSPENWTPLQRKTVKRGERARERMVSANLRLVVTCAKKWASKQINMEKLDLIQEGNVGLMRAAEKFDPTRGYKFSTYAFWWIRQGITRAISQQNRIIRLPGNALPTLFKVKDFIADYRRQHHKIPTLERIAEEVGATPESIKLYLNFYNDADSLDRPTANCDGDRSLIDIIPDPNSFDDVYELDFDDLCVLQTMVENLEEKHRFVIELRFGLDGSEPATLVTIGKKLGISREAARHLELRALKRLRVIAAQNTLGKICA